MIHLKTFEKYTNEKPKVKSKQELDREEKEQEAIEKIANGFIPQSSIVTSK